MPKEVLPLNLYSRVSQLLKDARQAVVRSVNQVMVHTYYEIGKMIVEEEQNGVGRAEYGKQVLTSLSVQLSQEFGKGFSVRNLEYMRKFYMLYHERVNEISQKASAKFILSWSHYVFLMGISSLDSRKFYEIESYESNWSIPELKRQFNSGLYERLALSRDKTEIRKLSIEGQIIAQPQDIFKEPYILEFLGLDEKEKYSESELETTIINKLEKFLLELGKGFLFEARQRRFTFDEDHFYVDLVFYNRLLRCYVLIDLKIGRITHQDLGQMQMYVNYFDRHVKTKTENSTIGIILCQKKRDALVEITLPKEANIYAKEYQLYLPSKDELRQRLLEWTSQEEA